MFDGKRLELSQFLINVMASLATFRGLTLVTDAHLAARLQVYMKSGERVGWVDVVHLVSQCDTVTPRLDQLRAPSQNTNEYSKSSWFE